MFFQTFQKSRFWLKLADDLLEIHCNACNPRPTPNKNVRFQPSSQFPAPVASPVSERLFLVGRSPNTVLAGGTSQFFGGTQRRPVRFATTVPTCGFTAQGSPLHPPSPVSTAPTLPRCVPSPVLSATKVWFHCRVSCLTSSTRRAGYALSLRVRRRCR